MHAMVDIETLSTRSDACVVSIGACLFDPFVMSPLQTLFDKSFITYIDPANADGHIDPTTVYWWLAQGSDARISLLNGPHTSQRDALTGLKVFLADGWHEIVWANSPSFDLTILESAFRRSSVFCPWRYHNTRDVRTLKHLAWPNGDSPDLDIGTAHNARDDAVKQAALIQLGYARLGLSTSVAA